MNPQPDFVVFAVKFDRKGPKKEGSKEETDGHARLACKEAVCSSTLVSLWDPRLFRSFRPVARVAHIFESHQLEGSNSNMCSHANAKL